MLILSRKHGERIIIGDDITVTIVRLRCDSVRVGIEAPEGMVILREELTERHQQDAGTKDEQHDAA